MAALNRDGVESSFVDAVLDLRYEWCSHAISKELYRPFSIAASSITARWWTSWWRAVFNSSMQEMRNPVLEQIKFDAWILWLDAR